MILSWFRSIECGGMNFSYLVSEKLGKVGWTESGNDRWFRVKKAFEPRP